MATRTTLNHHHRFDVTPIPAAGTGAVEEDDDDDEEFLSPRVVEYRKDGKSSATTRGPTTRGTTRRLRGQEEADGVRTSTASRSTTTGTPRSTALRRSSIVSSVTNPQRAQSNYSKLQTRIQQLWGRRRGEPTTSTTPSPLSFGAGPPVNSGSGSGRPTGTTTTITTRRRQPKKRFRIRSVNHERTWLDASDHVVIEMIKNYFKWTFLSSFVAVILSACILYVICCTFFALCIFSVMWQHPECIDGAGASGESPYFMDAYQLSWTTFASVGYGAIGPAVGTLSRHWYVQNPKSKGQCDEMIIMNLTLFSQSNYGTVSGSMRSWLWKRFVECSTPA
jgi:hypothetical protein